MILVDKFKKTMSELLDKFVNIKEILIVYLYGSVARGDYSLRHSDMDLFIVVNKKKLNESIKGKINGILLPISAVNGVDIHIEYQSLVIGKEDYTLVQKIIAEGKIIYANGIWACLGKNIGLSAFKLLEYSTKDTEQKTRTKLTQILKGRIVGSNKYEGLADNTSIIAIGKGALMVKLDKLKYIEDVFNKLNIGLTTKRIVFS